MALSTALAIIALLSSSASSGLCVDAQNTIAPDMRILESDLTQVAAISAAETFKSIVARGNVTQEFQFGALNQSKIMYGYLLRQQAMADRDAFGVDSEEARISTQSLCTWLSTKGFWHD